VDGLDFEWDDVKSTKNIAKHGLAFEYAATVFFDEKRLEAFNRTQGGEDRYYAIGSTPANEILCVVYTWRDNGETCRIISARKASKEERRRYPGVR
jgi:uncharacterized DUF497 family protein